jgi:hypothetical protein
MFEQLTVEQWRERILAGWDKWGTGEPLDPRTVEHLAQEFAKPLMTPPTSYPFGERSDEQVMFDATHNTTFGMK